MNICVFDTETIGLDKPFLYDIGIAIYNIESNKLIFKKEYIIEQIWHNDELFHTAYYANKKNFYIKEMRKRNIVMKKFGYVMRELNQIFKIYEIQGIFAYNSSFDVKTIQYNCDWFECINPFENYDIYDIRGHVHTIIAETEKYKKFCEKNERFTESGNYSTTAESVYQFIKNDINFIEAHTALDDTLIELEILKECVKRGLKYCYNYPVKNSIKRYSDNKIFIIDDKTNETIFTEQYKRIKIDKKGYVYITLKR